MITRVTPLVLLLWACTPKGPVENPVPEPTATVTDPTTPDPTSVTPVPTAAPEPSSMKVEDRVAKASELIESGSPADLEKAIQILETAANEDMSGVARLNLGVAYQKRGDLSRAANQYQAVIATHPDNGDAWLYLASVQQLQGQKEQARSNIDQGIRNDPENVDLRVAKINLLREQGRTNDALEEAKAALKINAKSLGVYNAFGLCYLEQGDLTLARFIFQKAIQEIEGAEDNAFLQTNLGWTYYLDENVPQATFHLKKALELDPNLLPAAVYLSKIYMEDHNYGDTVPLLENAERLDPNNAEIQLTLGVAYRGVNRLDDAEKAYRKALSLDPADPAPHFNLGVLIGDYRKDYDGAVNEFSQYIAGGGPERALAEQYIKDIQREKELSEKRAAAAAEAKRREEERKKKEELVKQAEPKPAPAPAPAPEEPTPEEPAPAPEEPAPAPEEPAPEPTEEPAPAPAPEQP
ncbi:MAG: tetratricopeptide repeat protein [Alphaproteobacteria bacterium]|nr:tetratricopeptide repeat protein [Alphaproteobacteria bacterium]MCB9697777.1 tetratricopeptide repeat protein [Alphaproteobacteria bacterium]